MWHHRVLSSSCSLWMMPSYWSHLDKEEVVGFRENQPLTQQASVSGPRGKDHDREKTYTSQEVKSRMGTLVRLDARSLEEVTQGPKYSVQFSSVTQSCPTLCDPMNRSTPGFPVHHQLPEFTQTHAHRVDDAIQPSHPLSSPSPPAPDPFQHQGLFQ